MKANIQKAIDLYNEGKKYSTSTSIDEDTILAGYGKLDYDFEFPLPPSLIIKEFGTTSWDEYFENKGYYRWRSTHKESGAVSIMPRMTIEQVEETRQLKGNENYIIERI